LVVAEELEIARFAASLLRIEYEQEAHVTDLEAQRKRGAVSVPDDSHSHRRGDPTCAFDQAAVKVKAEYRIPVEHHNPMEPYATTGGGPTPGRWWGGGGAASPPMTRRRGRRTAETMSPIFPSCRARRCACSRPMSAAASGPGCARSISCRLPCSRPAPSNARCA